MYFQNVGVILETGLTLFIINDWEVERNCR